MPNRINAQVQLNVPGEQMFAISGVFSYAPHGSQNDYNAELAAGLERVLVQLFQEGGSRGGNYNTFHAYPFNQ